MRAPRFHAPVNDVAGPDAREEPVGVVDCHEGDPVVENLHDVLADLGVLEAVVAALGLGGGLAYGGNKSFSRGESFAVFFLFRSLPSRKKSKKNSAHLSRSSSLLATLQKLFFSFLMG